MINLVLLFLAARGALCEYPVQYYHEDGHGGYDYGYDAHLSSKHESGDHNGNVHGSFSYVDGDGHHQSAHYTADPHDGFNIHATNLPEAVEVYDHYGAGYAQDYHHHKYHGPPAPLKKDGTVDYTPEVKKARAEHFAALHSHKYSYPQYVTPLYHSSYENYDSYHYQPQVYAGDYSHGIHYHGHYAPLKHDGTVDDLPEVKAARAHHLAEYAKVLYRHKRDIFERDNFDDFHGFSHHGESKYHGPPAPLNHDGTVAETPEVKHLKAVHFAAVANAMSKVSGAPHYSSHYDDGFDRRSNYEYPSHSHHDYNHKYYGPPAPLNHDGTVAETPEVKHAKAMHFQLFNKALHRYKRSPVFAHAPLLHDGRVDETPEVKHAKANFLAAHAAETAHADHSYVEPKYYDEPSYNFDEVSKPIYEDHSVIPSHGFSPIQHSYDHSSFHNTRPSYSAPVFKHGSFKQSYAPAPLNHDGTVADTPEIKAAKAVHFAAHQDALSRIASHKYPQKQSYIF